MVETKNAPKEAYKCYKMEAEVMEKICPLCNALEVITARCPECGGELMDRGPVEDFLGPYSPYMDIETLQNFLPQVQCVHLFACRACSYDTHITRAMVDI